MTVPTPDRLGVVRRFDRAVDAGLDRVRGPLADRVFYSASEAGNFSLLWHAAAWAPFLCARSPERLRRAVATSAALVIESAAVNGGVKRLFDRARPDNDGGHPHRLRRPTTSSFPSGHASAAMVAVMLLGRGRRPRVRLGLGVAAALVSTSRAYVRIHHPSDVVGGLVAGWVVGRVLRRLTR